MSNIIKISNNLTVNALKTFTSYNEVAGVGSIRWKNSAGFNSSYAVQIGETGEEQSEILVLGTALPSGTAGTFTSNTLYNHAADSTIFQIKYDKIIVKRSTSGTSGTADPITDGTINIDCSQDFTQYDDTNGASGYAYKTAFYNSVLSVSSSDSDWITTDVPNYYSLSSIRNRIRSKLWNSNYVQDNVIDYWINEWLEKMRNAAISVNQDYALGSTQVGFGTDGLGTINNSDFRGQVRRVWITYDNGQNNYQATKTTIREFIPDQQFSTTHPYFYMYGENVIGIKPEETGGSASIIYPILFTPLQNDTDELPISIKPYSNSFVDYGEAKALRKDQKYAEAKIKEDDADVALQQFKTEIAPRAKTGATYIQLVEPITGVSDGLVI